METTRKIIKRAIIVLFVIFEIGLSAHCQPKNHASWIWYPGDFEIWLHTEVGGRRQERGQPYPPFWRVDSPYGLIRFQKNYDIAAPETIRIFADGRFQLRCDGKVALNMNRLASKFWSLANPVIF